MVVKITDKEIKQLKERNNLPRGKHVDFSGADLRGKNFNDCHLDFADFANANLEGASFKYASCCGTRFSGAFMKGTQALGANFISCNLECANLVEANLTDALFFHAVLVKANLTRAVLRGANFCNALLQGANLEGIEYNFMTSGLDNCPDGELIGYKRIRDNGRTYIVTLKIPAEAKRSKATTGKCRAEYVITLNIESESLCGLCEKRVEICKSIYCNFVSCNKETTYKVGCITQADSFDPDRWVECSQGIHFFLDKTMAKQWKV